MNNPYIQQYRKTQVSTMDQGRLVLMVYEAAMSSIKMAKNRLQQRDLNGKGSYISRAIGLVAELRASLDWERGGEITPNLDRLYLFVSDQLNEANVQNDEKPLDAALRVLTTLYEGWTEIFKKPVLQPEA